MKVVVVEDEVRIRDGIQGLLEMMGGDFEFAGGAGDGKVGLELIRRENPDIIITDIQMPDMSGLKMLKYLREGGNQAKAVVLSAYSEFEYARQAMKLGVTEYLLKPVSVDEFFRVMNVMKTEIEKKRMSQPEVLGTLEQILSAVLYGQLKIDETTDAYLRSQYQVDARTPVIEVCVYLGKEYKDKVERAEREWRNLLQDRKELGYCIIRAEYEQALLILFYRYDQPQELERKIQFWMLQNRDNSRFQGSIGWICAPQLGKLKEEFEVLYRYMDWNLTLGQDVLISYPKVLQVSTAACVYPIDLENKLKTELCIGNGEQAKDTIERFHSYFRERGLFTPKDMKECYVRFVWSIINIAKEIDMLDYSKLNQQVILDQIMGAKLFRELEETVNELMEKIPLGAKPGEDTAHLTVKRVKSMIHEFYQSGITLDEIADKLNVTPEYLSMQFHKEMGETYSSYLKNYRVGKAKELLLGTQMKQYEVAAEVGYTDSKYFGRVFRECTGYTPAEYRKANK